MKVSWASLDTLNSDLCLSEESLSNHD